MKKSLLVFIIFLILFPIQVKAESNNNIDWYESTKDLMSEYVNELNTSEWTPYLKYIKEEGVDVFGNESAVEIIMQLVSGQFTFSWKDCLSKLVKIFFRELTLNLVLIVKSIVIAIFCGIFKNMNDSFNNPSVGEVGYFACYSIVMILVVQSFISILTIGKTSIDKMSNFMQLLFPVLIGLLMSIGNFSTAAILQPAIGVLVGSIGSVLTRFIFPLITLSAVTTLLNQVSERIQIKNLGKLLNNLCTWTLAFIFTLFISILAIQGVLTASVDGITIRTAKFAADTFVPIVGKMLSQSLDAIVGCALLVKNAVGAAGLIILTLLCFAPAMKILSFLFLYKFTGALLEPVTDKRIVESLNGIGNVISILLVTIMGVAIMFFLTISLMISTGNTTVMFR